MTKFFLRAFAILVVLTVAFPSAGLAHILYYCSMSGRVVEHCCCEPDGSMQKSMAHMHKMHEKSEVDKNSETKVKKVEHNLKKSPCCFLISQQKAKHSTLYTPIHLELPIAIQAIQPIEIPDKSISFRLAELPRLTPPRGPPPPRRLFTKHCSYLI